MTGENFDFERDFEVYNSDQLEHIERHMNGSNTTGSHFTRGHFSNAEQVVEYAADQLREEGYDGTKTVVERDLPETIGRNALVELDDVPEDASIETEPRGRNNYPVKVVSGMEKRPTRHMVIVAGPLEDTEKHGFYTIFPGKNAPPLPASEEQLIDMGYEGKALQETLEENKGYREFWESHALIENK